MAKKNKYGQYFTINSIAEFMVGLIKKGKQCEVLEPSCGKGVFLTNLIEKGFKNITAYEIDDTLQSEYSFIKYKSFISSPIDEKFDVVIGNPPYIRWKNLEPELKVELQENALWNKYFNSLCDYLFIFILKSIEQLNEEGELIFICTDYWMNTTHSQTLRNYMCENGYFSEIYHFKEAPLFEKVTASFVIFRYVKSQKKKKGIKLFSYIQKGAPSTADLVSLSCFTESIIPQFKLNSRWILATENVQKELLSFENKCLRAHDLFSTKLNRIGDICEIGNGMVSGLDAAFKITDTSSLNEFEKSQLIAILKAKDLDKHLYKSISKYIFVQEGLEEKEFIKKCPHFYEHFKPYIEKLNNRYNYNRNIPYWEFVFPRNKKLFETPVEKIFVPCKERISKKKYFRFALAPIGCFPLQDVTCIIKRNSCKESIEYILAYLNTEVVFDWLCFNGVVKGEIVEFSEAPIASIPYRTIDWQNDKEVSCHTTITEEMRAYLMDEDPHHLDIVYNSFKYLIYE